MEAFVSLWSADLLALGEDVRRVEDLAAGFHIDVFDGHNVPELLFGPDLVASLRAFTAAQIEVHLNVTDPGYWVGRFAAAGADIITVQSGPCPGLRGRPGYRTARAGYRRRGILRPGRPAAAAGHADRGERPVARPRDPGPDRRAGRGAGALGAPSRHRRRRRDP